MTKLLGGAVLAAALSAAPVAHAAPPTHSQVCASLLDELTGPASPALSGQTVARLRSWAERRAAAAEALRAFATAMASGDVVDAARQLTGVAASVRLLAHDEDLIETAQARHCTWAPEAAHTLNAH